MSILKRYERIYSGERLYKCMYCDRCFNVVGVLKSYERLYIGVRFYVCKECDECFIDVINLRRYEKIYSGERFYCYMCNKFFFNVGILRRY